MSKLLVLIIIAAVAALITGDVIEVKVHPDRLSSVPATISNLARDGSTLDRGTLLTIKAKRSATQLFIQDKERRFELAVLDVQEDADRLSATLADKDANPVVLLSQAQLLLSSIKQVQVTSEDAPVESVAALKEKSAAAFAQAQRALGQLHEQRAEYASIHTEFTELTQSLEKQIGSLSLPADQPATASEQTEAAPATSSVPLRF